MVGSGHPMTTYKAHPSQWTLLHPTEEHVNIREAMRIAVVPSLDHDLSKMQD